MRGTQGYCKECSSQRRRDYYQKNKERARELHLIWYKSNPDKVKNHAVKKYGITVDQYKEMYVSQNGNCKICGKPHETLHVDHCHKTGEVRGLLCLLCNTLLGKAKDDTTILQSAIHYLINAAEKQLVKERTNERKRTSK